jgi:predicted Zn-dependent peptidase
VFHQLVDPEYVRTSTPQSIASITRDDALAFHSRYYVPSEVTLIVVGDVRAADLVPRVERIFGGWKAGGERPTYPSPAVKPLGPTAIYLIDRTPSQQSYAYVGHMGPSRATPDFFALETLGAVLGSVSGSRLTRALREQHAFTYNVAGGFTWRRAPGASGMYASSAVITAKTDSAIGAWIKELKDIRTTRPPTAAEMDFARNNLVQRIILGTETLDGVADVVSILVRDRLPLDFYDSYATRIPALRAEDVSAAATKYLDPDHMVIVIVGERKVIEPLLRAANLAPVVVMDENGKPVDK